MHIQPVLEYGKIVWGPHYILDQQNNYIEKVQKRATKLIHNLQEYAYDDHLVESNLTSLKYWSCWIVLIYLLDCSDLSLDGENDVRWIKKLKLQKCNHELLLKGGDLNDRIINAAHTLLSAQFPEISGFQSTIRAHNLKFQPTCSDKLPVQILHAVKQ